MDFTSLGVTTVVSIVVICFVIGQIVKLTPWNNNQYISVVCLVSGAILGAIGYALGIEALATQDIMSAIATGAASGGMATALYEAYKGVTNKSNTTDEDK